MVNELQKKYKNELFRTIEFISWVERYLASAKGESDIVPSNFIKVYLRVK
jgi:hypothetical protein